MSRGHRRASRWPCCPRRWSRATGWRARSGAGRCCVKRDDLIGFGVAGNKTRPLEYLRRRRAGRGRPRCWSPGGGPGSNFVRGRGAGRPGRRAGLRARAVGRPDRRPERRAGHRGRRPLLPTGGTDRAAVDVLVERAGRGAARPAAAAPTRCRAAARPRWVRWASRWLPRRRSSTDRARASRRWRSGRARPVAALVVIAVGSGRQLRGAAGRVRRHRAWTCRCVGVSVSRPPAEITARVRELAAGCAALHRRHRRRTAAGARRRARPRLRRRRPSGSASWPGSPCTPRACCSTRPTAPRRSPSPSTGCAPATVPSCLAHRRRRPAVAPPCASTAHRPGRRTTP